MHMKTIKFKILILLIFALSTSQYSLYIFADTPNENPPVVEEKSTILDGEIGEWDPELKDKPNFNQEGLEVDGHIPNEGEYYTISVTVPLNMEFYVLPNSQLALGSFYSPVYTIKNNGSKNISVSIDSFNLERGVEDDNTTPLYVEQVDFEDDKTQIELKMCAIQDLDQFWEVEEGIDLTDLGRLDPSKKVLYTLSANEEKGVKFDSEKWELPEVVSNKEKAISNFSANFVFSVVR